LPENEQEELLWTNKPSLTEDSFNLIPYLKLKEYSIKNGLITMTAQKSYPKGKKYSH
jgi:hypothetical protein